MSFKDETKHNGSGLEKIRVLENSFNWSFPGLEKLFPDGIFCPGEYVSVSGVMQHTAKRETFALQCEWEPDGKNRLKFEKDGKSIVIEKILDTVEVDSEFTKQEQKKIDLCNRINKTNYHRAIIEGGKVTIVDVFHNPHLKIIWYSKESAFKNGKVVKPPTVMRDKEIVPRYPHEVINILTGEWVEIYEYRSDSNKGRIETYCKERPEYPCSIKNATTDFGSPMKHREGAQELSTPNIKELHGFYELMLRGEASYRKMKDNESKSAEIEMEKLSMEFGVFTAKLLILHETHPDSRRSNRYQNNIKRLLIKAESVEVQVGGYKVLYQFSKSGVWASDVNGGGSCMEWGTLPLKFLEELILLIAELKKESWAKNYPLFFPISLNLDCTTDDSWEQSWEKLINENNERLRAA